MDRSAKPGAGGAPFVVMVEATDVWDGNDRVVTRRLDRPRDRRILVQREVWSPPMRVDEGLLEVAVQRPPVPVTGRRLG